MSTAADADLELDQGADFGIQVFWLDPAQTPYTVLAPMNMEIRTLDGATLIHSLSSATSGGITFASLGGLIQLQLSATVTDSITAGTYQYDLYVTYRDTPTTSRVRRLMKGILTVNKKVTQVV